MKEVKRNRGTGIENVKWLIVECGRLAKTKWLTFKTFERKKILYK